jgi:hypothetical protein
VIQIIETYHKLSTSIRQTYPQQKTLCRHWHNRDPEQILAVGWWLQGNE